MKRKVIYQIVRSTIILTFLHSCASNNQKIEKDENGNIISKCEIKNGVRHGKCYHYYPNGAIEIISSWIEGVQDGETIVYFENGVVKQTSLWKDDKVDGEVVNYFENGNIESKNFYINGQIKEIEFYDEEGRLVKHVFYIILNGQSTLNGLLVYASHDADGNPDNIIWSKTAYAEIFTERDTIDYGSFVEYEINWGGGDYVGAMAGNYDHNFNLIDSASMKEVDLDNKNRFYPAHLGTDTLRIIFDFFKHEDGKEKVFSSHLEKVFTVIGKNE